MTFSRVSFSAMLRRERFIVTLFFGALLALGLYVHRDYGITWDEPLDRANGAINIKYIAERFAPQLVQGPAYSTILPLAGYNDNDHGAVFEIVAGLLGYVFAHDDAPAYYHLRHLLIFGFFWCGCLALYGLARQRFGDWRWALLTVALLVLSPRLFAEAFLNGKDSVFMSCFLLAMYTLARMLARATPARIVVHALATALAIDMRIPGLLIVGFTVGMLTWHMLIKPTGRTVWLGALYLLLTAVFVVIGWPALWEAPATNFWWAYQRLSHYPWDGLNIYLGHLIPSQVPWHYIPVWIIVTTPLPYLLSALIGLGLSIARLLRWRRTTYSSFTCQLDALFVGWFLGTLLLVIVLRSGFYDSWRHMYFIYPALVLLAVRGIRWVVEVARQPRPVHYAAMFLLLLGLAETVHTAVRMVRLHPYQQVYFSFLPAATAERLFERDYWGSSYYHGLQWLLAHRPATETLVVSAPFHGPVIANSLLFPPAERNRLSIRRGGQRGRYFITNYRWPTLPDSLGREIHTIRAEGIKILSIFDREAAPTHTAP